MEKQTRVSDAMVRWRHGGTNGQFRVGRFHEFIATCSSGLYKGLFIRALGIVLEIVAVTVDHNL